MSEKARFYEMTKPVKFRKLKQVKQYILDWLGAIRERIKYSFNYLLYKLNILNRYSYRDRVVQEVSLPHPLVFKGVNTPNFGGIVIPKLICERNIDLDYFYRDTKSGERKITLMLNDVDEKRFFLDSHLENILIKVDGKSYAIHKLPVFKVQYLDTTPRAMNIDNPLEKVETKVITLDTDRIVRLRVKNMLGFSYEDISEPMLHYYYNYTVGQFSDYLKSLTLKDITL